MIFAHFDYEEYRKNYYPKGYFGYEKNGFGFVTYDLKSTIKEIIKEIENNCVLGKKYLKRINKFFTFNDTHNNDRIFMELINHTKLESLIEPNSTIIYLNILLNLNLFFLIKNAVLFLWDSLLSNI